MAKEAQSCIIRVYMAHYDAHNKIVSADTSGNVSPSGESPTTESMLGLADSLTNTPDLRFRFASLQLQPLKNMLIVQDLK